MNDSPGKNNLTQQKEELEEKVKVSRRSKADNQNRKYDCSICSKSYLSYPALYTHKKNKHKDDESNSAAAKKSKTKVSSTEITSVCEKSSSVSAESLNFFSEGERKGYTSNIYFSDIFRDVFNDIFTENWHRQFKESLHPCAAQSSDLDKYNLYIEFMKQCNTYTSDEMKSAELINCDQVFAEYLNVVSKITNPSYFKRVLKFVILFREFLNKLHNNEKQIEFTASNTAESAPESSNEFIIEFMGFEEPKLGFKSEESIDLTLNLCSWMLDEKYTASKLTIK